MPTVTPIETRHNGYHFRSRLEARWAVFFETLGVAYKYEHEAFSLAPIPKIEDQSAPICYLPDFLIEAQPKFPKALWVEVKGQVDRECVIKLNRLVFYTKTRAVMVGELPLPNLAFYAEGSRMSSADNLPEWSKISYLEGIEGDFPEGYPEGVCSDFPYSFCQCPFCGAIGLEFDGRSARVGCGCAGHDAIANGDKTYNDASPDLIRAYTAARSARFNT